MTSVEASRVITNAHIFSDTILTRVDMLLEWKIEGQNQWWALATDEHPEDLPVENTKDSPPIFLLAF